MKNYFLVPMDFLEYDFETMRKEWRENKKIMWRISGRPVKGKDGIMRISKQATLPYQIKKDDVIYFYVCRIPSANGKDISRILLKGMVDDEPKPLKYKDVYFREAEDPSKDDIIGFSIKKLVTLEKRELENDFCYDLTMLENKYHVSNPHGRYWPSTINGGLNNALINDLENSFRTNSGERSFETLIEHFNRRCYFWGKLGNQNDHKTFKRKNGTDYYEIHHFVPEKLVNKNGLLMPIINDSRNKICLCSNCHNKLHYGRIDEIYKMIDVIWKNSEIKELLCSKEFFELINVETEEESLDWIRVLYKENINKKNL